MTTPQFATTSEREALCGFLDLQRAALIRKVDGISDADARRAPTASSLSLLERDTVEHWVASFSEQASISRQITAERDLDTPCAWPPLAHRNLRWVLLHMIEETARHAGRADIIRETLDGSRGI
jgi:Protein of unknown function (DUF664)